MEELCGREGGKSAVAVMPLPSCSSGRCHASFVWGCAHGFGTSRLHCSCTECRIRYMQLFDMGEVGVIVLLQSPKPSERKVSTAETSCCIALEMHAVLQRWLDGLPLSPPSPYPPLTDVPSNPITAASKASRSVSSKRLCGRLSVAGHTKCWRSFMEELCGREGGKSAIAVMPLPSCSPGSCHATLMRGRVHGFSKPAACCCPCTA